MRLLLRAVVFPLRLAVVAGGMVLLGFVAIGMAGAWLLEDRHG